MKVFQLFKRISYISFSFDLRTLLIVVVFWTSVSIAIELKCHYCSYKKTEATDFEETCDLLDKVVITPDMESDKFEFTGLSSEQKEKIKTLAFRSSSVAFVPKEAFQVFPNLERITMLNTSLEKIEYHWLKNFLKYSKDIKILDLRWNKINFTDPRVLEIFSKFQKVNLKWNVCVDNQYSIENGNMLEMRNELDACFNNYFTYGGFYLSGIMSENTQKRIERVQDEIQEMKNHIKEIRKLVEKMASNCRH